MLLHHAPLILASGSAIRQHMLRAVGLTFSVEVSGVDEDALKAQFPPEMSPADKSLTLARAKAVAVSKRHPNAYVIGCDQICALGERIFDKPETYANAEAHLKALQGHTHQQYSGIVLALGGEILWVHVGMANLTIRPLTDAQIHNYVSADAPLSACGAYKFESLGRHLFSAVEGQAEVIQGLPLQALLSELYARGILEIKGD